MFALTRNLPTYNALEILGPTPSRHDSHVNAAQQRRNHPGGWHRHHPQEHVIDNQARQVNRVKKFESGVISDPITFSPDMTYSYLWSDEAEGDTSKAVRTALEPSC